MYSVVATGEASISPNPTAWIPLRPAADDFSVPEPQGARILVYMSRILLILACI
jgi:hypothetical protein